MITSTNVHPKGACAVNWYGHRLLALASRALYHPSSSTLFAADMHLGKSETFRKSGIPVPGGTTETTLARLSTAIKNTGAQRLYILGDLLHARDGCTAALWSAMRSWRARHRTLDITLVIGNHDRHAGLPPDDLGFIPVDEPYPYLDFCLAHDAAAVGDECAPVIAGHLHPVFVLRDVDGTSVRAPCFVLGRRCLLPAIGAFTGGATVRPQSDETILLVGPDLVFNLHNAPHHAR